MMGSLDFNLIKNKKFLVCDDILGKYFENILRVGNVVYFIILTASSDISETAKYIGMIGIQHFIARKYYFSSSQKPVITLLL